jgi:hypothetical protein
MVEAALAHLMMGSVAERVVRLAPCPVLTVRHPEREFVRPDVRVDLAEGVYDTRRALEEIDL